MVYDVVMPTMDELRKKYEEALRRRAIVLKLLAAGERNYAEIGRKAGLTRERVRQIAEEVRTEKPK